MLTTFRKQMDTLIAAVESSGNQKDLDVNDEMVKDINHLLEVICLKTRIQMLEDELTSIKSICDHDPHMKVVTVG